MDTNSQRWEVSTVLVPLSYSLSVQIKWWLLHYFMWVQPFSFVLQSGRFECSLPPNTTFLTWDCGHPTSRCGPQNCCGTHSVGDGVLPNWYPHFTLPFSFCHHSWLMKSTCEAKKAMQGRVPFTNWKCLLLTRNTVRVKLNAPEATAIFPWLFRNSVCGL